jgi:mannose-6-phosphate isomerase-like protein (cupin superfamily)
MTLRTAPATGDEFFYVRSGEVQITAATERHHLSSGAVLLVPRTTTSLRLARAGKADAQLLRCTTGK